MLNKNKIILGLILVVSLGLWVGSGWAIDRKPAQKPVEAKGKTTEQKGVQTGEVKGTQAVTQEESEVNRIVREIREDYEKKMAILLETYKKKCKLIRDKGEPLKQKIQRFRESKDYDNPEYERLNKELNKLRQELYQLQLWKEEQERLLRQEKEKREEEIAKKYLQTYVMKKILFLPWGPGKGEVGLKEVQVDRSGSARGGGIETVRYGPSKIEVDKNGNIFIFDEINKKIHRYNPKGQKGKQLSSVPLSKAEKEPLLVDKFRSEYRYEFIRSKDPTPYAHQQFYEKEGKIYYEEEWTIGFKILDEFNKEVGRIIYEDYVQLKPLTIDREGNVYLLLDTTDIGALGPSEWQLEVHKYSKKGAFLKKIKLSTEEIDWTYRRFGQRDRITIDKEGNIYQLLPKRDGVYIMKYEAK